MIQRNTQNPSYWDNFQVTDEDIEHLSNLLVEREVPLPVEDLARGLVAFRRQREDERISSELSRGAIYLPGNSYKEGDSLIFPALEYAAGEVVEIREGRNPEHGAFDVIQVKFPGERVREFATGLPEHELNHVSLQEDDGLSSVDELYEEHGPRVRAVLEGRLEADAGFVRLAGHWFLKSLLVEINAGQLNLAEAVLDVANGGPLPTESLIGDLDVPSEVSVQLGVFSLNYALQEDERFDEVGPAGEVLWYLRHMEPSDVLDPAPRLRPQTVEYDHRLLDETMLNLERRLDDEWSDLIAPPEVKEPVVVTLTYPHRRSGTLPLSPRLAAVLPTGRTHRIRFLFRDGDTKEEMPGWVVRERHFVYGLGEWYEQFEIPVGAYLEFERAAEPGVVIVRRQATRRRREWLRVATVEEGLLSFEMTRHPVSCKYDELMVVAAENLLALDAVGKRVREKRLSLEVVVAEIFPELAKLSPQGTVHAATLYSVVNTALRVPPGPILSLLVTDSRYSTMGDNYWVIQGRDFDTREPS